MVDTDHIDKLVDAISEAIVDATDGEHSHAIPEVISALTTVLGRCVNGVRNLPPSADKTYNVLQINQALMSLMVATGKPH